MTMIRKQSKLDEARANIARLEARCLYLERTVGDGISRYKDEYSNSRTTISLTQALEALMKHCGLDLEVIPSVRSHVAVKEVDK
jgi:hypothetical protein